MTVMPAVPLVSSVDVCVKYSGDCSAWSASGVLGVYC